MRISYSPNATLKSDEDKISQYRTRAGRFILATNVLEVEALSADDALNEYKGQQGSERGFRFLKGLSFFASSVFLKASKRIEALRKQNHGENSQVKVGESSLFP